MGQTRYDYVAVGHVTCDVLADGCVETSRPGGTAFYSALQAARLGLSAKIVTQGVPAQIEELLAPYRDELALHVIEAPQTTTLATRLTPDRQGAEAARSQRVLAWAGAIAQPLRIEASILHLAPVARETAARWDGEVGFVGITPQGLVRDWGTSTGAPRSALESKIEHVELDRALLPERFDAAVVSEHERPSCRALFAAARGCGACVAVTAGSRPATMHVADAAGAVHVLQSATRPAVAVRDDLGAGDVFAAAFFVALAEGRDPLTAASFANAAAAERIAGDGPAAIGSRAQIETLLT